MSFGSTIQLVSLTYLTSILNDSRHGSEFGTINLIAAVREAFQQFRKALSAITTHVIENFEREGEQLWELDRKYKKIPWNPKLYDELLTEFQLECVIVWCLTIELTKAANLVIRAVREELDPFYRFDAGVLLAEDGDAILSLRVVRLEYDDHKWGDEFPVIDLSKWRAMIQDNAAERQRGRLDDVNPYEIHFQIHNQFAR